LGTKGQKSGPLPGNLERKSTKRNRLKKPFVGGLGGGGGGGGGGKKKKKKKSSYASGSDRQRALGEKLGGGTDLDLGEGKSRG